MNFLVFLAFMERGEKNANFLFFISFWLVCFSKKLWKINEFLPLFWGLISLCRSLWPRKFVPDVDNQGNPPRLLTPRLWDLVQFKDEYVTHTLP